MSSLEELEERIKIVWAELAEVKRQTGYSIDNPGVIALNTLLSSLEVTRQRAYLSEKIESTPLQRRTSSLLPQDTASASGSEDSIWQVPNVEYAGLSDKGSRCYVRNQSVKMWTMLCEKLDSRTKRPCWIQGPPGVGKSTELFGWLMHVAQTRNLNVVWIHRLPDGDCQVIMKDGDYWSMGTVESIRSLELPSAIDIVVLDGLREDMIAAATKFVRKGGSFIICCTPYGQTHVSSETAAYLNFSIPWQMMSWEKEEYQRAVRRGIVITDVNDNPDEPYLDADDELTQPCRDRLDSKFYLAGLSMRFMQMPAEELASYLQMSLEAVKDFSILLKGLAGFRTAASVHSLMGLRADGRGLSCVVSEYVLLSLGNRVDLSFVREAQCVLPRNPSWQGWVFELEVLVRLRHANCLRVRANHMTTATEEFSASKIVKYDFKTNSSGDYWVGELVHHNTIAIPTQWNNATFDFVHIAVNENEDRYNVTFFNATIATEHSFDYKNVAQFLEVLFPLPPGVKKRPRYAVTVAFVAIVPNADLPFKWFEDNRLYVANFDCAFEGVITKELVRGD